MSVGIEKRLQELEQAIERHKALLAEKKQQAKALRQKYEAQQKQRSRKEDTRRKIIVGAVVLGDPDLFEYVKELLDRKLTADRDRALFDLPPLPKA